MNTGRGVGHMHELKSPQMTLILNIYLFIGLTPEVHLFFLPFFDIFSHTERGEEVWPSGTQPLLLSK